MLEDLDSGDAIAREVDKLLKKAHAYGRFPTPVGDIIAAAKLSEAKEDLFDDFVVSLLPTHLRAAIARIENKVHAALDREEKLIYINSTETTTGAKAFKKLHEVVHEILPWQCDLAYADDAITLSPATNKLFEREANQGAAELLFQRDLFSKFCIDYELGFASIVDVSQKFGSSIHAAFRRFVETTKIEACGLVIKPPPKDRPQEITRRETFSSVSWGEQFKPPNHWPTKLDHDVCPFMDQVIAALVNRSLVQRGEFSMMDLNGKTQTLSVEVLFNSYHALVFIWRKPKRRGLLPKRKARIAA